MADATPGGAARAAAGTLGLDGACTLVRVGPNLVYRCGPVALRVNADGRAHQQLQLLRALAGAGLPVARPVGDVHHHGPWQVTALEWADHDGHTLCSFEALGEAVAALHRLDVTALGDAWPQGPCTLGEPWAQVEALLAQAAATGTLGRGDVELLEHHAEASAGWRDAWQHEPLVPCHGDVHPGNVRASGGRVVLLDWDACGRGPATWDHAAIVPWETRWGGGPGSYAAFARGYGRDLRDQATADGLVQVRLLIATLNLLTSTEPSMAAEGRRRLAYWRHGDQSPTWTPQ